MAPKPDQLGRRYPRIVSNVPVTLLVESEGKKLAHPCQLLDVSVWGLRVKGDMALKVGNIVEAIPNQGPRYPVRSRVVWVGRAGSNEEKHAGVELLSPCPTNFWITSQKRS